MGDNKNSGLTKEDLERIEEARRQEAERQHEQEVQEAIIRAQQEHLLY